MLTEKSYEPVHNRVRKLKDEYYIDKRTYSYTEMFKYNTNTYCCSECKEIPHYEIKSYSYKLQKISKIEYLVRKIINIFVL